MADDIKAGEIWAIALSEDGRYLAGTTYDGRVNVWDTAMLAEGGGNVEKIREYETKGSFGMSIDLVRVAKSRYRWKFKESRVSVLELRHQNRWSGYLASHGHANMNLQSSDGELTASGHANGSVYIFNNSTGRLAHSLQGLVKPVRAVAFSPACKFLAAAGDSKIIALYDVQNGEQVANLTGSGSWIMSLDWSSSGEWLLSG